MHGSFLILSCVAAFFALAQGTADADAPTIKKLGTIDCDMVETTPIVFKGKLYRFEYVRKDRYKPNKTGDSYFRFIDTATDDATPSFATGYHLGSAFVDGGTMYVYGVKDWGASGIHVFWSTDLAQWKGQPAIELPGWEIYNTSVCKGKGAYVMAFEIGGPPEQAGHRFTMRFAKSADKLTWELAPAECVYSKDRYTACPALALLDGQYYMIYLEAYPGPTYAPHIVRSKDLIDWQQSPFNPIMKHSDAEDKKIANPNLTPEQREHVAKAKNINNSDVDFCQFGGKTIIAYSWGDQHGTEFLAEAVFEGSEADFLKGYFPEAR